MLQYEARRPLHQHPYQPSKIKRCIFIGLAIGMLWLLLIVILNFSQTHSAYASKLLLMIISINTVTLVVNAVDKLIAKLEIDVNRVPENNLHLLTFFGGAPSTAAAMVLFRHKSSKVPYQDTYFILSSLHILFVLAVVGLLIAFTKNAEHFLQF